MQELCPSYSMEGSHNISWLSTPGERYLQPVQKDWPPTEADGHRVDSLDANKSTSRRHKILEFHRIQFPVCAVYHFLGSFSVIKPLKASLVARWLKSVLTAAGIDTAILSAHSTREASSSAAANVGITTSNILKAADWSSESVFQKFHLKICHLVESSIKFSYKQHH